MSAEIYALLVLLHLLLFVYWLGADIGVFYSARYVQDTTLTLESRRTALRIMGWVDQLPRYSLVLMLPVGTTLGVATGVIALPALANPCHSGLSPLIPRKSLTTRRSN